MTFKSPKERAEDAQVALLETLSTETGRKEIGDVLESVFSCLEAASRDTHGIRVSHGHEKFRSQHKLFWETLEEQVWTLVQAGVAPEAIYQKVAANAAKQFEYRLLSSEEALGRLAVRSADTAAFARVGRHPTL